MLEPIDEALWTTQAPLRFGAVDIGCRMTVAGLDDGSLVLHSPVPADPKLVEQVEELGSVAWLVAPNRFHHLYVADWQRACPEARLLVAPGLETKRSDLTPHGILPADAPTEWQGTLDSALIEGMPLLNEVVLLHRPSRTLVVTDLAFNVGPEAPWATRLAFRLIGRYDSFGPTLLERFATRNRDAARESLERVLEWPFDRIVVSHGEILETGGPEQLAAGYRWLLDR